MIVLLLAKAMALTQFLKLQTTFICKNFLSYDWKVESSKRQNCHPKLCQGLEYMKALHFKPQR